MTQTEYEACLYAAGWTGFAIVRGGSLALCAQWLDPDREGNSIRLIAHGNSASSNAGSLSIDYGNGSYTTSAPYLDMDSVQFMKRLAEFEGMYYRLVKAASRSWRLDRNKAIHSKRFEKDTEDGHASFDVEVRWLAETYDNGLDTHRHPCTIVAVNGQGVCPAGYPYAGWRQLKADQLPLWLHAALQEEANFIYA